MRDREDAVVRKLDPAVESHLRLLTAEDQTG